ncbi:MAG: aldehyde ferredoxin oxidoreductase N-terminal domain-containing protein, partial [Thermodesulfobacteriota bacterium]
MATQYKSYTGRIADIDLSTGKVSDYELSDRDRELFLGGRFLASRILWDELRPGIDPLSPENVLVVMTGPLTGSGAPSSSRYDISAKSPLTGGVGHSNSGGNFGIHLKRAGFDGLVIRGAAEAPVYLSVENGKVLIKSAKSLWGLDTQAAQAAMGEGGKMVIGPAGENLVRFASVVSQERSHGRTGMGAVMGAKKLKGVVARGKARATYADKEGFSAVVKDWTRMLTSHPMTGDRMPKLGTAGFVMDINRNHALPTRNFAEGSFSDAAAISGERLASEFLVRNYGCVSCPIRCGRVVRVNGREVKGPEYEIL